MQSDWFKGRMKHLRVTQEDVGRALLRDRTVAGRIINGEQPLKLDEVLPLADLLDVNPLEILFRADMWKDRHPIMIQTAALLSEVEAGRFFEAPTEPPRAAQSVIVDYPKETIFGLVVRGDSMNRIAGDGSVVIVDYLLRDLSDGQLGVFRQPDGSATFKRYRDDGRGAWLQPESSNPRHTSIFPEDGGDVEIIGRVIDIRPEHSLDDAA